MPWRHGGQRSAVKLRPVALLRAYIRSPHPRAIAEEDMLEYVRPWTGEVGQAAFYEQISQFDRRYTDEVEPQYASVGSNV